ncbi:MAG: Gfo/Idh/MocA family oxidoreductase, partial [Bryobacterales bacterium]|nr:Gfo/Idh/MocA family oxidoreductase [Bryobacterales bacterium]
MAETPVSTSSRRAFSSTAAASASFLIVQPQQVRGSQANSALTIGLIGCGGRGLHDSGIAAKHEFARISAICDIYDDRLAEGRKRYSGAKEYKNYKELISSDVDAVMICTPAFLHHEHFEAAVNAKKHIFMEKPAGVDPKGCQRVVDAARRADKSQRITVDYQQRYGAEYRTAYD